MRSRPVEDVQRGLVVRLSLSSGFLTSTFGSDGNPMRQPMLLAQFGKSTSLHWKELYWQRRSFCHFVSAQHLTQLDRHPCHDLVLCNLCTPRSSIDRRFICQYLGVSRAACLIASTLSWSGDIPCALKTIPKK